jgi:N-acetylneuraminic acid mutarotase
VLPVAARQRRGEDKCLYVLSGRRQAGDAIEFLTDVWEFTPRTEAWRRCADAPRCVMAGAGCEWGASYIVVLSGDDGTRFHQTDELRDRHPGFPREVLAYDVAAGRWTWLGPSPQNQVTTTAVMWNGRIIVASGEVRPRVRTPKVWSIGPE